MINSYLCGIQRTENIKIFIKESKIVNDSKLMLMHFVWFIYSPTKLFYASPTESEIFANATNHTSNNNEEMGNQEETAISKNQNCKKILLG